MEQEIFISDKDRDTNKELKKNKEDLRKAEDKITHISDNLNELNFSKISCWRSFKTSNSALALASLTNAVNHSENSVQLASQKITIVLSWEVWQMPIYVSKTLK